MKPALIIIALGLVTACTPAQDAKGVWDNYMSRLETVMDDSAPAPNYAVPLFQPPRLPETESTVSVGVLDLFKLDRCRLGALVSERNSTLGKVSTASQQFIYHVRFIQLTPECLSILSDESPELSESLNLALVDKQQTAVSAFDRMLVNDASLRQSLFAGSTSMQLDNALAGITELEMAVKSLLQMKRALADGEFERVDAELVESNLEQFYRHTLLQRYMAGSRDSLEALEQVNLLLAANPDFRECAKRGNNRSREILATVFRKYYLPGAQAYLSRLRQIQLRLGPDLIALFKGTAMAEGVNFYFAEGDENTLHGRMETQIKQHVAWWQQLQDSCGNLF